MKAPIHLSLLLLYWDVLFLFFVFLFFFFAVHAIAGLYLIICSQYEIIGCLVGRYMKIGFYDKNRPPQMQRMLFQWFFFALLQRLLVERITIVPDYKRRYYVDRCIWEYTLFYSKFKKSFYHNLMGKRL